MKPTKLLSYILITALTISLCPPVNYILKAAEVRSLVDISSLKLSDSKRTMKGTTTASSSVIQVDDVADFEKGQGIAIEKAERISNNEDGTLRYTWFAAEILDVDKVTNKITINRIVKVSLNDATIKHDNYFPFRKLTALCPNNSEVIIPKGDYEVNAMMMDAHLPGETASTDVDPNTGELYFLVINFGDRSNIKIDFSGSKILLNGDFHRNADAGTLSRTSPLSFLGFTNCNNIEVLNVEIDGRANTATKSAGVVEPMRGDTGYGIRLNGIRNSTFENIKLVNHSTDGILLTQSNVVNSNITLRNMICDGNARQGLSVISVNGLTVENCEFTNTGYTGTYGGHFPMSGIDLEIESAAENRLIENVTIKNCFFSNNRRINLLINGNASRPYNNILIENTVFDDPGNGIGVGLSDENNQVICTIPVQKLTFRDCLFVTTRVRTDAGGNDTLECKNFLFRGQHANQDIRFENTDFLGGTCIYSPGTKITFDNCNFFMEQSKSSIIHTFSALAPSLTVNNSAFYYNLIKDPNNFPHYISAPTNFTNTSFYFAPNIKHSPRYTLGTKPNSGEFVNVKAYTNMIIRANGVDKAVTAGKSITTTVNNYPASNDFDIKEAAIPQSEMDNVLKNYNEKRDYAIARLESYGTAYIGTKIKLNKTALTLNPGQSDTLTAAITSQLPVIRDVKWSSSNNEVVSVNGNGVIKALASGTAVITAEMTQHGYQSVCTVEVTMPKAIPTIDDLTYTIPTNHVYTGNAQGIGTVKARSGITGLGAITVRYNNSTTLPVNAGTYAVTVDIAEGASYSAVTGLSLGSYTIAAIKSTYTLRFTKAEYIFDIWRTPDFQVSAFVTDQNGAIITYPELDSITYSTASGAKNSTGIFTAEQLNLHEGSSVEIFVTAMMKDGTVLTGSVRVFAPYTLWY